jgi:hypothetical protein
MKNPEIIFFRSKFLWKFGSKRRATKGPQFCVISVISTVRLFQEFYLFIYLFWLLKNQVPNRACLLDKFSFLGEKIFGKIFGFLKI